MRTGILILGFAICFFVNCHRTFSQTTSSSLYFFVVSEDKIENGRFIDQPNFERLGFINPKPDLTVAHLQSVSSGLSTSKEFRVDNAGNKTLMPPKSAVFITLETADGKKMEALTANAFGKRMLLMLGNTPLMAPRIGGPITSGHVSISFSDQAEMKKVEESLKRLVR